MTMIDADTLKALHDAEQEALCPKELRDQGWIYRDIPGKFSFEMWDFLLSLLGKEPEDYRIIIMSEGRDWRRGQFLLGPTAQENLRNYAASKQQ